LTYTIVIAKIIANYKGGCKMKFVTVSELRQRATQIISEVESTHEQVVVTKMGKPVALIQFITEEAFSLTTNTERKEVKKHGRGK